MVAVTVVKMAIQMELQWVDLKETPRVDSKDLKME